MRPVLTGIQTNLYMVFMDTTWRNSAADGSIGLLHPESHFTDPKAGLSTGATTRLLRRHWQFFNELSSSKTYCIELVWVQSTGRQPAELLRWQCCFTLTPSTGHRS